MKKAKTARKFLLLFAILVGLFVVGCAQATGAATATAPTVTAVAPANAATGVALNPSVTATFSAAMDSTTIIAANFTVKTGTTAVAGTVTYTAASKVATFVPTANLAASTAYTATITTGVKDSAGTALAANKVWTFTTGTVVTPPDTTPPTVVSVVPLDTATAVTIDSAISATFSKAVDPATLAGNITITPALVGTTTYDAPSNTATFTPTSEGLNTLYTVTIGTGVKDVAGNALAAAYTWSFTTAASLPNNPTAPTLGTTAGFVVIASQYLTTTGTPASALSNGNLGIMDEARSYYTGFTPGTGAGVYNELTGGLSYAHDDTDSALFGGYSSTIAYLNQVRSDLTAVNNFLQATNATAANISLPGLASTTLTRGVYVTSANVTLSGGNLTLDAQGDSNSVWIFVIGGTFMTGAGGNVVLANGAQAKNVYWDIAGTTNLGAPTFYGTVVNSPTVAVQSGVSITGRLFSMTNNVTLISDTVTNTP